MNARKRIALGLSSAALVLGTGAGIATATSSNGGGGPGGGGPPGAAAIATYLGLTADQVRTQLESGKTLAQVATAQGKTVSGLEAAIVADAKSHLDAEVTAGTITAAQETARLADLSSHVDDFVNSTGPPKGGHGPGGPGGGPASAAIASYLGLTRSDLMTQLEAGKTLAQVATAQGKSVSGLEAAIVADAKTHLDAEVTAGTITAAQEATRLADLSSHVDDLVNSTGPPQGGPRGGPGGAAFAHRLNGARLHGLRR
jgi:hypothetical protein